MKAIKHNNYYSNSIKQDYPILNIVRIIAFSTVQVGHFLLQKSRKNSE